MAYCNEYVDLISAAVDGALSPSQRETLNDHLACCPECRALYDDLLALHAAFESLPPVEVPEGLTRKIMTAVAADNVTPLALRKSSAHHWKSWAATAAVLAVILIGSQGLRHGAGSSRPASAIPQSADLSLPETTAGNDKSNETPSQDAASAKARTAGEDTAPEDGVSFENINPQSAPVENAQPPLAPEPSATVAGANENDLNTGSAKASDPTTPSGEEEPLSLRMARSAPSAEGESDISAPEAMNDGDSSVSDPQLSIQPFLASIPLPSDQPETIAAEESAEPAPTSVLPAPRTAEAQGLTSLQAMDLVVERCFGESGYEMLREELEGDALSCHVSLLDDGSFVVGGTIVYTGETEEFFRFECHWDDDPENPYHYSVHKTEGYVAWQGEALIDGQFLP